MKIWITIILLFVLGQIIVNILFGLNNEPAIAPDSGRYLSGEYSSGVLPYMGYIAVIAAASSLGGSVQTVILFHIVFVLIAARALVSIGQKYNSTLAGMLSASFYLLFPELAQWTRYVLTESLFYSFTIIIVYLFTASWKNTPRSSTVYYSSLPLLAPRYVPTALY
jgi:4-amino-4-deoxy-L-arabinose transferase-like glycosyltransferase